MCCRFYVEPEDEYFRQMAERIAASPLMSRFRGKLPVNAQGAYGGEVAPTSVVPVLAPNRSGEQTVFPMQWGYTLPASGERKPRLIINARSETAAEKPLFRDSWRSRRCVVPVTAYFEWEHRTGFDGKPKTVLCDPDPRTGGQPFLDARPDAAAASGISRDGMDFTGKQAGKLSGLRPHGYGLGKGAGQRRLTESPRGQHI